MTPPAQKQPLLFVTNGNGEDSIAAEIIRNLPKGILATAYPMVGTGAAYDGLAPLAGPRLHAPSEGWRHTRNSLRRDIKGGALKAIPGVIRFLRAARGHYAKVIFVGDGFGLLLCRLAGLRVDVYLDVFKSGYAHNYNGFERFILRHTAKTIFCRDDMLASALRQSGLDAHYEGNIMLDCVPYGDYDIASRRTNALAVTLLPGSRAITADNLRQQVDALRRLPAGLMPDMFVAVAPGIDAKALARATGLEYQARQTNEDADYGRLIGDHFCLHLAQSALGNVLEGADIVLSQAGTATQQALGLGKPVITFDRQDNRRKRMDDEQKLMGEARYFIVHLHRLLDPDAT